ncbi:MAG: beta-phosphoglucomutase family hydrolase [Candidatus Omnitrophica bacterium]|nr:beta-phosphoglucomutase family hydrolase [Candidatus Omnitrophota bacterium]
MFKGAIFDLDGVIVNTVPLHFEAWKKMFSEYKVKFDFQDYKAKVDGIPRYDGTKAILKGLSEKEIKEAGDRKQKFYLESIEKNGVEVYDSSVELIKELKYNNIKIAYASASRNCRKILEKTGLSGLGDAIIDGNIITRGKPDPQIFLMAAEQINCKPAECVVFEDAVLGVQAAINAKMVCVGIDRYQNSLRLVGANIIVEDLSGISYTQILKLFAK